MTTNQTVLDTLQRPLRDLRISVTDRCNFRCTYCMPKEVFGRDYVFLERAALLSFEEITRLARIFAGLGVHKLRLTGGEPLLRRDFETLVSMLANIDGLDDIAMTTNGSLLTLDRARALKAAGLKRVTVSLDSLDDETFMSMNDVGFPASKVLEAIDNAATAGLAPVKVDMVVKRGINDQDVVSMARHFRGSGHILRFIEFMDVGSTNGWRMDDVVSAQQIRDQLNAEWPIEPVDANYFGEVAERYRYADGAGEIGIIASVTAPFCSACTRARLSADGELYTCLFGVHGHDLRALLRNGSTDEQIEDAVRSIWSLRTDRYSDIRSEDTIGLTKVEMSKIGG
ncbi:MAG TPA: GTP 3',8-cyclase MoaA [Dehalococcoidia bacterium]|nr:GTP 3',8-cyclase MoaA [Dehalococcoidia bacterium]